MGELSKKIGEEGESLVLAFLERIGWSPIRSSVTLSCEYPKKHKLNSSKKDRRDHGIDLLFSYLCPVVPGERRNVLISVKNSRVEKTTSCPSIIRDDFKDLNTALECFRRSHVRSELSKSGGASKIDDCGILIRINRDPNVDKSIRGNDVEALSRIALEGNLYFVENDRFDFVDSCMQYLDHGFRDAKNTFNIQRTSLSLDGSKRIIESDILPLHSLVGGPIVVRSSNGDRKCLILFSNEGFSEQSLEKLIGLSQISDGWPTEVRLIFPDYNSARMEVVERLKARLEDRGFANSIVCDSFEVRSRLK